MKRALFLITIIALLILPNAMTVYADMPGEEFYPWRDHASPFEFRFLNMIDSHQQSSVSEKGKLQGFIYIHYTGEFTEDGYPMAERANCPVQQADCNVGWVVKGVPITAKLVNKAPRIWLVSESSLPKEGGYTHFQWVGDPEKPKDLVVDQEYEGILLKRVAPSPFFWLGNTSAGGGGGCGGHETGSHETGGMDEGGCSDGGCTDGHDEGGGSAGGGHGGRLVLEGVDVHTNIVTVWDGTWHGDGCED